MSTLAALILVLSTLVAVFTLVSMVASWSEGLRLGRKPVIIVVAIVAGVIVQLPLAEGPDWRNVPLAFAMVLGNMG